MAKSTEEIEDEVRAVLLKAKKKLGQSWGDIYFGRAQMPPDWQATQRAMVTQAIAQARKIMAENRLEASSVDLFERYRISELQKEMDDAVQRLAFKANWDAPEPEAKLTKPERKALKQAIQEFITRLKSITLPDLPPEEAIAAVRRIEQESSLQWQEMRPQLDVDLDLQRQAYERWQAVLQRLSNECGRTRHLAAKFEKILVSHLPPSARPRSQRRPDSTGLFYELYEDGQLRRLVRVRQGESFETLELSHRKAEAKWEDSANVAEFHADNTLDEYGGRYERESRYPGSFQDWVLEAIRKMSQSPSI
ncbi:hypothetical protein JST97_26670 [bacterium]|nr:hypothetical protein [bacterium]